MCRSSPCNGASHVLIWCMVLEIKLLLIHTFHNVVVPCFRELGLHKSRKNSCSSRTMQGIKTRLVLLRWWGPVHSNDNGIVGLMCSWRGPQRKTTTFQWHPSAPKAVMRFSGFSLHFCGITDYLHYLFLRVRVPDYGWCTSINRLFYI